jgi:hypothetical protein
MAMLDSEAKLGRDVWRCAQIDFEFVCKVIHVQFQEGLFDEDCCRIGSAAYCLQTSSNARIGEDCERHMIFYFRSMR